MGVGGRTDGVWGERGEVGANPDDVQVVEGGLEGGHDHHVKEAVLAGAGPVAEDLADGLGGWGEQGGWVGGLFGGWAMGKVGG